jgi:hypothetical protein
VSRLIAMSGSNGSSVDHHNYLGRKIGVRLGWATPRPRDWQRHDAFDSAWLRDSSAHKAEASPVAAPPRDRNAGRPTPPEGAAIPACGSNSVKGDRETSTKLESLLASPLITETPKLQAVSANTSAGDKFLHLGLKDQTTKFAEQVLPFRQRRAHLICCKPETRRSSLPTSMVSTSPQPFWSRA